MHGRNRGEGGIVSIGRSHRFATIVPIYVHFDKSTHAKLGAVVMVGSSTKPVDVEIALPKKPQRASVNATHDVLSR
jgi:hypothetical protein